MEQDHMQAGRPSPHAERIAGEAPYATVMQQLPAAESAVASVVTSPMTQTSQDSPRDIRLPPLALSFPTDSSAELAPIQPPHERPAGAANQTLPPLSSVTGAQHASFPSPPEPVRPAAHTRPTNHWPSLNPFTTYYTPSYLDPAESPSPSVGSERSVGRKPASVSLDDPDVRIAAEALGQMRTDCGTSPRNRSTASTSTLGDRRTSKGSNTASPSPSTNKRNEAEPEPLLSLITTSHPLVATTIDGAASVYNHSKNYSPHIKTGAEYVESYLKPVGKAVGNVSRKTGVEGGMRWIFGMRSKKQRAPADIEAGERGSSKRRKPERDNKGRDGSDTPSADLGGADAADDRRMSISTVDTLPAYDDQRSPAYTEVAEDSNTKMAVLAPGADPSLQRWPQRFVVTTSGLGVAMKQESLKSLRYCLSVLRDTNGHITSVLVRLKSAIDEYDQSTGRQAAGDGTDEDATMTGGDDHPRTTTSTTTADRNKLIQLMRDLGDDIFAAIERTVGIVSRYAGSALPENARNLVHRQLMSLPGLYQFHYVREAETRREREREREQQQQQQRGNGNVDHGGFGQGPAQDQESLWARDSAHLALLFAREALLLMTQVGDVLNRTLVSAEQWCEALYKNREQQQQGGAMALPLSQLVGFEGGGDAAVSPEVKREREELGGSLSSPPTLAGSSATLAGSLPATPCEDIVMSG